MLEDLKNKLTMIIKGTVKVSEGSQEEKNEKPNEQKKKNNSGNIFTNLIILFLGGVLLVIVSTIFKPESMPTMGSKTDEKALMEKAQGNNSQINSSYKDQVEKELIASLENIEGVGKVHAMIHFEGGEELLPAINSNGSKSNTIEKDPSGGQRNITQNNEGTTVVMTTENGESKPVITKKLNPKIVGVLVTAEGASDKVTELRIRQAVSKLFGLSDNKVEVYPMKR